MGLVTVKNKLNQKITASILTVDLHAHTELVLGPRETSDQFDSARLTEYTRKLADLGHVRIDTVSTPVVATPPAPVNPVSITSAPAAPVASSETKEIKKPVK